MNYNSHASVKLEMKALLDVFDEGPLNYKECRRSAMIATCDLRAATFHELFDLALENRFLAKTEDDEYRLTAAGAMARDSVEPESAQSSAACLQTNAASTLDSVHRQLTLGSAKSSSIALPLGYCDKIRLSYGPNFENSVEIRADSTLPSDCQIRCVVM